LENAKQGGKEGLRGWNARRKSSKRRSWIILILAWAFLVCLVLYPFGVFCR
jgi:hypothetical protein